jgi:selenophosphate synthase
MYARLAVIARFCENAKISNRIPFDPTIRFTISSNAIQQKHTLPDVTKGYIDTARSNRKRNCIEVLMHLGSSHFY